MSDNRPINEFLLEEHKALRAEILNTIRTVHLLETSVLVAIAALYGWIAAQTDSPIGSFVWWVPPLVAIFGCLRWVAIRTRLGQMAEYIRTVERFFVENDKFGWEQYIQAKREARFNLFRMSFISGMLWAILIVVTVTLALIQPMSNESNAPQENRPLHNLEQPCDDAMSGG